MSKPVVIHEYLRKARETSIEGLTWLDRLPGLIDDGCHSWNVEIAGAPYEGGVCGWVAPVRGASGDAVLKVSWPLPKPRPRPWRCVGGTAPARSGCSPFATPGRCCSSAATPGTPLRDAGLPNERGLAMGAELLNALWSKGVPPDDGTHFDSMHKSAPSGHRRRSAGSRDMVQCCVRSEPTPASSPWASSCSATPLSADRHVVVHGDFNPGNLLAASRATFLAIDPKPMVGDPAYDPWSLVAQLDSPSQLPASKCRSESESIAPWSAYC